MIAKHHGKHYPIEHLREVCHITKYGVSMMSLSDGAEEIGFRTVGARLMKEQLFEKVPLPCIAHLHQNHFVIVYGITKKKVLVANPAKGLESWSKDHFLKDWFGSPQSTEGLVLLLEPGPDFYQKSSISDGPPSLTYFLSYLKPYKKEFARIAVGMFFATIVSFILPFLSQSVIDVGLNNHNLRFVQLVIIAQVILMLCSSSVNIIQVWISLHIGTKMSISMLSDFISKLLHLPVSFFQNRSAGDILQRMGDNGRVLGFITSSPLSIIFSLFNLLVYGAVMLFYNATILAIFFIGNVVYALWLVIFLRKRREMDYERFDLNTRNENLSMEMIYGIEDIKLNNIERTKRREWETIQAELYKFNIRNLRLSQIQGTGAMFIHQAKNIFISFLAAKLVIDGDITLGMMFAIQYIIARLEQPFGTFIGFIHSIQDVKISLDRLTEVVYKPNENNQSPISSLLPGAKDIVISDVTFKYDGKSSEPVLQNITCTFPKNTITAIVGKSGSGKSTLLKLLLKLNVATEGSITADLTNLNDIKSSEWRRHCSSVMQGGYIFSESILYNVTLQNAGCNIQHFLLCCQQVRILDFVRQLPLGFETRIGKGFLQISEGQKQRILLARALYRDADHMILDEITSSLDAENEAHIVGQFHTLKASKTIILAAHQLGTMKMVDQIIVLDKGKILERGTHDQLIENPDGLYYSLLAQQLQDQHKINQQ
jgi:ATP-binding cassette subfamily B protein